MANTKSKIAVVPAGEETSAAVWVDIGQLRPWGKNPRKNAAAVPRVAESLKRFGWGRTLVARSGGEIIVGHTARLAALQLIQEYPSATDKDRAKWHPDAVLTATHSLVPVRYRDDLSEHDAHLLALADNKLGELAEWDDEIVAETLSQASFADALLAGWDGDELEKIATEIIGEQGENESDGERELSDHLKYSVIVECEGEAHQTELLERLESEGLTCKPLVS
jgi:hypothetical protein